MTLLAAFPYLRYLRHGAQLLQCNAVHIFVDQIVQAGPEIQRVALAAVGTIHRRSQTRNGRQLPFYGAQDLSGVDLGSRAGQTVAALCAAHAGNKAGFCQRGDDLLQIF